MQKLLISIATALLISLTGCSVYKLEIQQGNALTQEKVAQLKVGMDKRQVQFVLGTPSLSDPFHPDRWDYIFSLRKDDELIEDKHLVLYFEGEKLARIEQRKMVSSTP